MPVDLELRDPQAVVVELPLGPVVVQHREIADLLKEEYSRNDLAELRQYLAKFPTFDFQPLDNGLFPAAIALSEEYAYTGYANVWVRDNIHVAHALYRSGDALRPTRCVQALMQFFVKYGQRLVAVIEGRADHADAMQRPHIRFRGNTLEENVEVWPHAQNDALGYFLWLYCELAVNEGWRPEPAARQVLGNFVRYFEAVQYWQDEDSGHWEEVRKVAASSVGAVVAGLRALDRLVGVEDRHGPGVDFAGEAASPFRARIARLEQLGQAMLAATLPAETISPDPTKHRSVDAAVLFLAYPLQVLSTSSTRQLADLVRQHLMGAFGIKRYLGDSYWCANYKANLAPERRTGEFADDLASRDALLQQGQEAQWCIFDSILAVIHTELAIRRRTSAAEFASDCAWATHHFNRALGQLTAEHAPFGPLRCPESYYLEEGTYGPNDITPLYWTQGNLLLAFAAMERLADQRAASHPHTPY